MMHYLRWPLGLLICCAVLGCGGSLVKPKGRVMKGGAPFQTADGEALRVILAPADGPEGAHYDSYPALYNPDNATFQVVGKDGKGLPPGKYRVGLELIKKKEDVFKGALMGRRSPFTCEVTNSSSEIVVDLDQAKDQGKYTKTR